MKKIATFLVFAASMLVAVAPSFAQSNYPNRAVKIIVGFAPGGLNDVIGRLLAQRLTVATGQTFFIENRPGAAANLATEQVARSEADGYTLLLTSSALAIAPSLYPKLGYNTQKDLAPIIQIGSSTMLIMVNPNTTPITSLGELVLLAKASPGKLNYASAGQGSPTHLASEMFKRVASVDIVHVPYKGTGPSLNAALSGEVQVLIDVLPAALPMVKAGNLRALAVTSEKRSTALPSVPTAAEAGLPGYVATSWYGLLAPIATPKEIIVKLNSEISKVMNSEYMKQKMLELGAEGTTSTPQEFAQFVQAETTKWAQVVRAANIKVD
jgi:tripartite-type tricarboxylate transporter receptor subunit TctC